jgi:hypothetical protein
MSSAATEAPALTLALVTILVRDSAQGLRDACRAFEVTEGRDRSIMALLRERAVATGELMWRIENASSEEAVEDAWWSRRSEDGSNAGLQMQADLTTLPVVAVALLALEKGEQPVICDFPGWDWCLRASGGVAGRLLARAARHAPAERVEVENG